MVESKRHRRYLTGAGESDEFVASVLGPCHYLSDLSRQSGRVVAVDDEEGGRWIVKTPSARATFKAEARAYENWVPCFADQAPLLRAADPASRTLILQRLPGTARWTADPQQHLAAGSLLSRLHTTPPGPHALDEWPGSSLCLAERMQRRLEAALQRAPAGVVNAEHQALAARSVAALQLEFDDLVSVPCHGDFGAHNWLRHGESVSVIDFGAATLAPAVWDFARLYFGQWWERPELSSAFFTGYGRSLSSREQAAVRLQMPVVGVSLLTHASLSGNRQLVRRASRRLDLLGQGVDPTTAPTGWRRLRHEIRAQGRAAHRIPG